MERGWLCCLGQEEQRGAEEVSKRDTRIRTMGKWMADSKQAAPNGQTGFLAQGVRLEGTLDLASAFRIDGEVKGPVRCQERLVLPKPQATASASCTSPPEGTPAKTTCPKVSDERRPSHPPSSVSPAQPGAPVRPGSLPLAFCHAESASAA